MPALDRRDAVLPNPRPDFYPPAPVKHVAPRRPRRTPERTEWYDVRGDARGRKFLVGGAERGVDFRRRDKGGVVMPGLHLIVSCEYC